MRIEPVDGPRPYPEVLLAHDPRLSDGDRATVRAGRSALNVEVSVPAGEDAFAARKRLIVALGTVLGADGVAAVDVLSQQLWTREQLDDEISHEAPLHVDQMHTRHAVGREDGSCHWLHSHGLRECGGTDFDILLPHPACVHDSAGLIRAAAFAALEGRLAPSSKPLRLSSLENTVRGVALDEFMRSASAEQRALFDDAHSGPRMVLCDPAGMLPWSKPSPARLFQRDVPDGTMVYLSNAATDLAARRARGTYPRLRAIAEEFAALELPVLVKLGYEVDGDSGREHLWFTVDAFHDSGIDATLVNDPHQVAHLRKGDRRRHTLERLSDWTILTPVGTITPHSLFGARRLRKERPKVEKFLEARRKKG